MTSLVILMRLDSNRITSGRTEEKSLLLMALQVHEGEFPVYCKLPSYNH